MKNLHCFFSKKKEASPFQWLNEEEQSSSGLKFEVVTYKLGAFLKIALYRGVF